MHIRHATLTLRPHGATATTAAAGWRFRAARHRALTSLVMSIGAGGPTSPSPKSLLAVIPVRDGRLPLGALDAAAECGGRALLAGSSPDADALAGVGTDVALVELGPFHPARWAEVLAGLIGSEEHVVVLPASPDGRDLAPRLARRLDRPLRAGALAVSSTQAVVVREGGTTLHEYPITGPTVVTLQPGVRGALVDPRTELVVRRLDAHAGRSPTAGSAVVDSAGVDLAGDDSAACRPAGGSAPVTEPEIEVVLAPDVTTMDLSEATRIVGGGAGLDGAERFRQLSVLATELGAAMGVTRVITDRGWVDHQRQIGTTGVVVDPLLYLAFGVSGAVQHTTGLGTPEHIVSVNLDPHCPMMQMADLAVVADANAVLDELASARQPRLAIHG